MSSTLKDILDGSDSVAVVAKSGSYFCSRYSAIVTDMLQKEGYNPRTESDNSSCDPISILISDFDPSDPDMLAVEKRDNTYCLTAGGAVAFEALLERLFLSLKGKCPFEMREKLPSLNTKNIADKLSHTTTGDARVMFFNILFDDLHIRPNKERNFICAELVAEYGADVICMEECGIDLRASCQEADIKTLMKQKGYEETLDFHVDNIFNSNYTPIFYNPVKLGLVESSYYRYRHHAPGISDEDKSSKGITWAVFNTCDNRKFIVINTHMCTQSDFPRLQQARELCAISDALTKKYPYVPILLGGDFNTVLDSRTYAHFIEHGFEDAIFVSQGFSARQKGHHAYPVFDEKIGYMVYNGELSGTFEGSVDHILYTNACENFCICSYGVIINKLARACSDHSPAFVDFTF